MDCHEVGHTLYTCRLPAKFGGLPCRYALILQFSSFSNLQTPNLFFPGKCGSLSGYFKSIDCRLAFSPVFSPLTLKQSANSPGFTSHHLESPFQRQVVGSVQELQQEEGMACVMNEVRLGYFNVPSSFDIIKHHYGQCTCLSWMMLHLTFNDTIERGSKLVQAQHFSGFPFSL